MNLFVPALALAAIASPPAALAAAPAAATPAAQVPSVIDTVSALLAAEHVSFSDGRGKRWVGEAEASRKWGPSTIVFSIANGRRDFGSESHRGTRAEFDFYHDWTERLTSRTTASLGTNSPVFARHRVRQEIGFKVADALLLQGAVGHTRYYRGVDAPNWSAGATYYFGGGFASYRYTGYDVEGLGNTHSHLVSVRLDDGRDSKGFTQAWVGGGTSLHEIDLTPDIGRGKVRSVALRRVQPLGGAVALDLSAGRNWYDTDGGDYRGTTLRAGLVINPR